MRRLPTLLLAVLLTATAASCGSDGSGGDSSAGGSATEVFPGVSIGGEPQGEPTVEIDEPFTVDSTDTEVLDQGDGEELAVGDTALVRYIGLNGRTGDEFDNSWSKGDDPVAFPLTEGGLIAGFLDGLVGQQVGSRVAIAISADDGYGPSGGNPQIDVEKDDSLVFVIDIVGVQLTQATGAARPLPDTVPRLETDANGVPTGFSATGKTGPAPKDVTAEVAIAGEGDPVEQGQTLTLEYLVQIYPDGAVLDNSFAIAQTVSTGAGSGQPPCWDALVGQAVGSRVVLECPPGTVFGRQGNKQAGVDGDDTLLFAIDILTAG